MPHVDPEQRATIQAGENLIVVLMRTRAIHAPPTGVGHPHLKLSRNQIRQQAGRCPFQHFVFNGPKAANTRDKLDPPPSELGVRIRLKSQRLVDHHRQLLGRLHRPTANRQLWGTIIIQIRVPMVRRHP